MRIALVCPYSFSAPGGVQSHVVGLATELRRYRHEVEILAPADSRIDVPGFVRVGRSVPIPDNGSIVRVALGPRAIRSTVRLVRSGRYDLVHVHEPMIPAVSLGALLGSTAPLVGTFHMYAPSRRWYRPFAPLARRAIPRLNARIAVSRAALAHVERTVPGDYRIIPNGIDVSSFAVAAGNRTGSRVLFIGRPDRRKGLHVLLEAFALLPPHVTLDLVGVPPDALRTVARRLPASVVERITAHGRVTDEQRAAFLGRADVLCVPSLLGESFGIVLVEGMAAGVPVVASAIPGYVDVLPERCGRLVPPGNAEALAAAIDELLDDPALRHALGEAGREAAQRYDWSRVAVEVLEVYEEALTRATMAAGRRPAPLPAA